MIMIILVHYGQNFSFSVCEAFQYLQMGCPIFFVASGFGIMCLINNKYNGNLNKSNTRQFYGSRLKALAPGWYIAFVIIFSVNTILLIVRGKTLSFGSNRDPVSIVINLLFLHGLIPFCNNNVMPGGWYIGTTVILYALTPIILKNINKWKNRKMFFIGSSIIGMLLWGILSFIFKDSFSYNGFDYYFFLVHYPEYLLGIILYYDLSELVLSDKEVKRCLPLGIVFLTISIVLFYYPIRFLSFVSAWTTAIAAYWVLYYMLSNEKEGNMTGIWSILEKYGRNSYCIYLLHAFFAYPFVQACVKICDKMGIPTIIPFIILIPLSLILSYIAGLVLNKVVGKVSNLMFSNNRKSKPQNV